MIDQELKKRALEPAAKGDPAPREKVLKVGKMITDVIEHKLGKVTSEDAEYWGLEALLTDEMCDIMLAMKVRKPHTVPELWKLCNVKEEDKQHFQEVLDKLAFLGLLEYDYGYHYDHNGRTAPQSERRYFVPIMISKFFFMFRDNKYVEMAMQGLKITVLGLIGAAALLLMNKQNFVDYKSYVIFAIAFIATFKFKMDPILMIIAAGIVGYILY